MTSLLGQIPAKVLCSAVLGALLAAALTFFLAWHWVRRLLGVPRVPRTPATYLCLAALWVGLVGTCLAATGMIVLLRDHRPIDEGAELAELRCAAVGPGHLQMELRLSPAAPPERYELQGDACVVWVRQVELRPGLALLGVRALARVDGIGQLAHASSSPEWLTPRPARGHQLTDLIVRRTETVPVTIPQDPGRRLILLSTPGGPTLEQKSL